MRKILERWIQRAHALIDGSAWLLIAPAFLALFYVDPALARTFAEWGLFFLVLAGVAVIVSRIIFPHLNLGAFLEEAKKGNLGAALVAGSLIIFVGVLILSGVLWVKGS